MNASPVFPFQGNTTNTLDELERDFRTGRCTLAQLCSRIAKQLNVKSDEVAILRLRHGLLDFIYPAELKTMGALPVTSSSQAAKTAVSKKFEMFNNFAHVQHTSIFETVKIGSKSPKTIQKLMTGPILSAKNEVMGVLQISRKGETPLAAGADFRASDLTAFDEVSRMVARVFSLILQTGE